jgi:hypothetical protein
MTASKPKSAIDAAFEAWKATRPSEVAKVMMLSYLWGLLAGLERDGELSRQAVKEIVKAVEKHTGGRKS